MLSFLPGPVKGTISFLLYIINSVVLCTFLCIVALLKLIIPISYIKKIFTKIILFTAESWISINNQIDFIMQDTIIDVKGMNSLKKENWYLVTSNHQSWVDILILQKLFNRKIPLLKFFIKKQLKWVPFLGLAWWALDFPFMQRYSSSFLKTHPHLRGKDLETTRKACEKFKDNPTSIMNFAEGTRFTKEKQQRQKSPYNNLLIPKAGGMALVLNAISSIDKILNVTIVYHNKVEGVWGYFCGKINKISINIETIPLTQDMVGDYFNNDEFKSFFQKRINTLWDNKDKLIDEMKRQ